LENKLLDRVTKVFTVELPYAETLDGYLNQIIPLVRPLGEDLREDHFYLSKAWLEFRDDVNFHKTVLHFFNEGGEYLRSVDGNVSGGSWRYLERANKMLIEHGSGAELFDLAYLDDQFFILLKHGDQERLGQRKYFVMMWEPVARRLEWRNVVDKLYDRYRNRNSMFIILVLAALAFAALILIYSQR
jgi:hypothetical protein